MEPGKAIQALEANIMAIAGISLAGIAQTNYESHYLRVCGNSVCGYYG
jgi:hypothetical protein